MAVLGLRFCARDFSSCGKQGPLFIAVRRPLIIAASLVEPSSFLNRHQTSIISSFSTLGGGSFLVPTWSYWDCHGAVEMGQKVVTY